MSWGTCNGASNNIHFNFPGLMDDGRNFTKYETSVLLDSKIKKASNIKTNSDYRKYLQNNANAIIKNNQLDACNQCGSCMYNTKNEIDNNNPYIFKNNISNDLPFGYENSDLKELYLSRKQLDSQKSITRLNID